MTHTLGSAFVREGKRSLDAQSVTVIDVSPLFGLLDFAFEKTTHSNLLSEDILRHAAILSRWPRLHHLAHAWPSFLLRHVLHQHLWVVVHEL